MHFLRTADVEGQPAEPQPKDNAQQKRVREFAQDHREQVYQATVARPDRFRDLVPQAGEVSMDDYLVPAMVCFTEFSGDATHRSNYTSFLGDFEGQPGVLKLTGAHGSIGLALRLGDISKPMLKVLV
jgi:hypothetical protein